MTTPELYTMLVLTLVATILVAVGLKANIQLFFLREFDAFVTFAGLALLVYVALRTLGVVA